MMRMGLGMVAILAPLQLFIGDQHGLNTLEASADQGRRDGERTGTARSPATLVLFAMPDEKTETNRLRDLDPEPGASLILTHELRRAVSRV